MGLEDEYLEVFTRLEAAQESDVVEQALAAARERLRMDAAYVGTLDAKGQTIHAVVGKADFPELVSGAFVPLDQTYCVLMLNGDIPNVVNDTRAEPALRDMIATRYVGAYVGVPVTLANGEVHGTLCAASNETRPDLGSEELRFMRVLADIVAARIDRAKSNLAQMTERFRLKA